MNNDQIKALATQVAIVRQALTVAAAVSEDLRVALQPCLLYTSGCSGAKTPC